MVSHPLSQPRPDVDQPQPSKSSHLCKTTTHPPARTRSLDPRPPCSSHHSPPRCTRSPRSSRLRATSDSTTAGVHLVRLCPSRYQLTCTLAVIYSTPPAFPMFELVPTPCSARPVPMSIFVSFFIVFIPQLYFCIASESTLTLSAPPRHHDLDPDMTGT